MQLQGGRNGDFAFPETSLPFKRPRRPSRAVQNEQVHPTYDAVHSEISKIASRLFYEGRLECADLATAEASLPSVSEGYLRLSF